MTPEWLKNVATNLFLLEMLTSLEHNLFTLLQCLDLDLRHSGPRPRRDFGVTRPRPGRDFKKLVLRQNSICPPLLITVSKTTAIYF